MKLLLIDGNYYVYRSFFAIRDLSNSRGEPTNAIYGFVKAVRRMVREVRPDFGAVMWDTGTPQRRVKLQPEYKQHRAEMPELLRPQFSMIHNLCPLMGCTNLSLPDTEADDLMASYAAQSGCEVILATGDKDLFQMVDERVKMYSTGDGGFTLLGTDEVRKKWGINPTQIGDVLALTGDDADNIPGVDGIGPKTAAALLAHDSLDALLADLDGVKNERLREKLKASRAQIEQNREMVRLDLDLPLPQPLEALGLQPRWPELVAELEKCEFKSLLAEVISDSQK